MLELRPNVSFWTRKRGCSPQQRTTSVYCKGVSKYFSIIFHHFEYPLDTFFFLENKCKSILKTEGMLDSAEEDQNSCLTLHIIQNSLLDIQKQMPKLLIAPKHAVKHFVTPTTWLLYLKLNFKNICPHLIAHIYRSSSQKIFPPLVICFLFYLGFHFRTDLFQPTLCQHRSWGFTIRLSIWLSTAKTKEADK